MDRLKAQYMRELDQLIAEWAMCKKPAMHEQEEEESAHLDNLEFQPALYGVCMGLEVPKHEECAGREEPLSDAYLGDEMPSQHGIFVGQLMPNHELEEG